jgi:hypothetical protein
MFKRLEIVENFADSVRAFLRVLRDLLELIVLDRLF